MNDLISRQAAIDALGEKPVAWSKGEYERGLQNQWGYDVSAIKQLPPAKPKPKRGKWIYKTDLITVPTGYWECSECKEGRLLYEANFCPNCGAEMKVTK